MTDLSSRIDALSPGRRALLEQLRRERDGAIQPRSAEADAPLSFAQQRMWFLDQYEPDSPLYNVYVAVRLTGALDVPALERAVGEVCRRHEVLRTVYVAREGVGAQVVMPPSTVRVPVTDLGGLPSAHRESAALAEAVREARVPFDLARGPLLRARLLRVAEHDHVLMLTMHHIVADGWALGVFVTEFSALYPAYAAGRHNPLPEPPIQYADFAHWQRDRLTGPALASGLDYWRGRLADAPRVLELPTDRPYPPRRTGAGHRHAFRVDPDVVAGLRELCRGERSTLFMALLTGFAALLSRYTGETDLCVGTPIANRLRSEVEGLVGSFMNTLVLRTRLAGDPSFRQALGRVRDETLAAYEHQEVPFERLVEELSPQRHTSHLPLFQVMVVLQNAPMPALTVPGLTLRPMDIHNGTAKCDLTLLFTETGGGLEGWLEYATDLFDDATADRMVDHYRTLLAGAVAAPDAPLWSLPVPGDAERHLLVDVWNRTATGGPAPGPVFARIARQAADTPSATAVLADGRRVSYRELDRRANHLAGRLRALGVRPDTVVGVCLERSADLVVALLAVHKAGGAHLPLEPDHPADRLRFMLTDAGAPVVVTRPELAGAFGGTAVVPLVAEWAFTGPEADAPPQAGVRDQHLAYVIYTSGSTGVPKGVMCTHEGLANYVDWMQDRHRLTGADRVLVKTPFSFDISLAEYLWPLAAGACLVVARPDGHRDPGYLVDIATRERISVLHVVPSMLAALLDEPGFAAAGLRQVLCGGEALPSTLVHRFFDLLPSAELHNLYGPTEAAIDVTVWRCRPEDGDRLTAPIGRPIGNTRIYLLDPWLNPLPVGVAGELYAGGAGLARGYLNRPDLTAERFVPDPFGPPGGRLYRTGDRARYLPDGRIAYVDRVDRQVKIRGFRVEPGEIEAALAGHPEVRQAAVVARPDASGTARLIGYLVAAGPRPPGDADLRAFLRERLPEHLVPGSLVFLADLPLTTSGKVDRAALPEPPDTRPEVGEFVAPTGPTESALAEVWGRVLGLDAVGATDNFFALGGDSMHSIRVLALARERGLDLSLPQMFEHQTIRELATVLTRADQTEAGEAGPATPDVQERGAFSLISDHDRRHLPDGVTDAYPLTFMQSIMVYEGEMRAERTYGSRAHSFHLRGPFDLAAMRWAVDSVAARHPVLRTSVDLGSYDQPLQLVHERVRPPLAVDDLRGLSAAEQEEQLSAWRAADASRGFRLDEAPLVRFHVHRRTAETFQFSLSATTIVLDGWSAASLLSELFLAYEARLGGAPSDAVPAAPASVYREFVRLELAARASDEQRGYWTRHLAAGVAGQLPRWPVHPDGPGQDGRGRIKVPVGPADSAGLQALARAAGIPVKSVLLAAHLRVLSLLTGRDDMTTGLVSNGRLAEPDGDRVLGQFLNVVPVTLRLAPGSWAALARQVFDAERAGLPFRRYPVAGLRPGRAGEQRFETGFNFVHFHVYQALRAAERLELLDVWDTDETGFTLFAEFSVDPVTFGVELDLEVDATLISAERLDEIARFYSDVLTAMARTPDRRHERHPLPPEREYAEAVGVGHYTSTPGLADRTLVDLFAEQVRQRPDAVAVRHRDERLTYRELDRRANRLAQHLRGCGVGPETVVGVCVERSAELVVAMLAVLRAGGGYLPVDPAHPPARQARTLADARAAVVLAREATADQLPAGDARVIRLDREGVAIARHDATAPDARVRAGQLACVVFTSGSTGRSKVVGLTHAQVVNRLAWGWTEHPFGAGEVCCQKTPLSFVDSLWELLGPLLRGVPTVVVPDEAARDPYLLAATLAEYRVTRILLVPTLLRMLLDAYDDLRGTLPALDLWVSSGEALASDLAREFAERMPGARLVNVYGASEAWDATWFDAGRPVATTSGTVPVGRPITNMRAYVLDRWLQPVPVGVPGELYVGGLVARGYLHDPAYTAERFVPDPRGDGERLYRTGDLACYLPAGAIHLLGRTDQQVNVHGVRVEPGEIELVLRRSPGVREAVVVPSRQGSLVAFLTVGAGHSADPEAVRRFTREHLPEHLVPARVTVLDEVPLTASGKVDRLALRAYADQSDAPADGGCGVAGGPAVAAGAPRNPVEDVLAAIWAEVLGRDRVGVHDAFFDLGGDSLLATQIVARVRKAFGVELAVWDLFQEPTVAGQVGRIMAASGPDREAAPGLGAGPGALLPVARDPADPAPLSFAQRRLWMLDQMHPGGAEYNVDLCVRLRGDLDVPALRRALAEIVHRHEVLRTAFALRDGEPVQVVHPVPDDLLVEVDMSGAGDGAVRELAEREARRPFDLARGPMLRATLIRLAEREHVALVVLHHVVCDAWSIQVFLRELVTLYPALRAGEAPPLPALPVQYADYTHWQRAALSGPRLAALIGYWRERLDGAPPVLDLADRPRPDRPAHRGGTELRVLPPELANGVKVLAGRARASLFMALLAAFAAVLHGRTGRTDVVVGTDIAGRDEPALEDLVGFFVNQLVLRVDLSGAPTFGELLQRVRDTCLAGYAHDLPFDQLVEAVRPERGLGHAPLFQVKLVHHNVPAARFDVPGLAVEPFAVDRGTAQLDLNLRVAEEDAGLYLSAEYDADLFPAATVQQILAQLEAVLERVVTDPDVRLDALRRVTAEVAERDREREDAVLRAARAGRLKRARRRVAGGSAPLVTAEPLAHAGTSPVLVRPALDGVDLAEWARANRETVESHLHTSGGVLFQDFGVRTPEAFQRFMAALYPELVSEHERSSPRSQVVGDVYTSTDHPADQKIFVHNEMSYSRRWPMRIGFCCLTPPSTGGATPIADVRTVLRLLDPELRERLVRRRVQYLRSYGDGFGLSWQESFQTVDRAEVEAYCRSAGMTAEWKPGDRLRTRRVASPLARHPVTGELVWFNHATFFHVSTLEPVLRDGLLADLAPEDLPTHACYADGTEFEPELLDALRAAYDQATLSFPWRKGDLLLLDNMLVAHGRAPFTGDRKVVVAMAEPVTEDQARP